MLLKQIVDRKNWEACAPAPAATTAGHFFVATPARWPVPRLLAHQQLTSTHYFYDPRQDAWIQLPAGTLGNTVAGACGTFHSSGPTGTASAGAATTITTVTTLNSDVSGHQIRITAGTGAGQTRTISTHTLGANSVVTVSSAWTVNPDNTSVYLLLTGRFYCLGATGAAVVFKYFDVATQAWTAKSVTSGPGSSWSGEGQMVATAGALQTLPMATGTATAGAGSTLTNSGKAWTTNQWANSQVRITGGTGAGQVRTINSNTGTVLTVSAAWGTNPDNTSVYTIEGNDDWIYVVGNGAVTMFRYAISGIAGLSADAQATGDTWITLAPTTPRASVMSNGGSLNWISDSTDTRFNTENTIVNGQRIYSFGGGSQYGLHYYDISAHTWVTVTFGTIGPGGTGFTSGTSWCDHLGFIYGQKDATGRFYRFNAPGALLEPLSSLLYAQGNAVELPNATFLFSYVDGSVELQWLYNIRNSGTELFRMLLI